MKPILKVKLFKDGDKVAELETINITELYPFLRVEFEYGSIRTTYRDHFYNEATFETANQCKVLASLFKEKPLLDYIYNKEL